MSTGTSEIPEGMVGVRSVHKSFGPGIVTGCDTPPTIAMAIPIDHQTAVHFAAVFQSARSSTT